MTSIPPYLVPTIRAVLVAQGFPADTISDSGVIDFSKAASSVYDTIEVRTRATPPVVLKTSSLLDDSPPSPVVKWLQPTVILTGRAGRKVIAPYGIAGDGTQNAVLFATGFLGGVFLLGFATGRI